MRTTRTTYLRQLGNDYDRALLAHRMADAVALAIEFDEIATDPNGGAALFGRSDNRDARYRVARLLDLLDIELYGEDGDERGRLLDDDRTGDPAVDLDS